ncbi:MAG: Holliday junction branch migration protein RuvA, partial [Bacteroidales bacterium]
MIHISLYTFSKIKDKQQIKLLVHHIVRDDAQLLFGFFDEIERRIFLHLISVSGVGANTARMILSGMNPQEVAQCILNEDVKRIQSVKGIGAKTAQRIILDLKDKIAKEDFGNLTMANYTHPARNEALSALVMLGFQKNAAEKVLDTILAKESELNSEGLIKLALKML